MYFSEFRTPENGNFTELSESQNKLNLAPKISAYSVTYLENFRWRYHLNQWRNPANQQTKNPSISFFKFLFREKNEYYKMWSSIIIKNKNSCRYIKKDFQFSLIIEKKTDHDHFFIKMRKYESKMIFQNWKNEK